MQYLGLVTVINHVLPSLLFSSPALETHFCPMSDGFILFYIFSPTSTATPLFLSAFQPVYPLILISSFISHHSDLACNLFRHRVIFEQFLFGVL